MTEPQPKPATITALRKQTESVSSKDSDAANRSDSQVLDYHPLQKLALLRGQGRTCADDLPPRSHYPQSSSAVSDRTHQAATTSAVDTSQNAAVATDDDSLVANTASTNCPSSDDKPAATTSELPSVTKQHASEDPDTASDTCDVTPASPVYDTSTGVPGVGFNTDVITTDDDLSLTQTGPLASSPTQTDSSASQAESPLHSWLIWGLAALVIVLAVALMAVLLQRFNSGNTTDNRSEPDSVGQIDSGASGPEMDPAVDDRLLEQIVALISDGDLESARRLLESEESQLTGSTWKWMTPLVRKLADRDAREKRELEDKIQSMQADVLSSEQRAKRTRIDAIGLAVGNSKKFSDQLLGYAESFPEESRATDFRIVSSNQLQIVDDVNTWNELQALASNTRTPAPEIAQEWVPRISELESRFSALAESTGLQGIASEFRNSGQSQLRDDLVQRLVRTLDRPGLNARFVYRQPNAACYYMNSEPTRTANRDRETGAEREVFRGRCFRRFGGNGDSPDTNSRAEQWNLNFSLNQFEQRFHAREIDPVLDDLVIALESMDQRRWDETFVSLLRDIDETFANATSRYGGEPMMAAYIIGEVLRTAAQGSRNFERAYQEHLEVMKALDFGELGEWLNPLWESPTVTVDQCESALKKLDELRLVRTELTSLGVNSATIPKIEWRGWLRRGENGDWQPEMDRPITENARLLLLWDSGADQPLKVLEIDQDAIAELTDSEEFYTEGLPVFVVEK